jgi:hypothetical protein
MVDEVFKEKMTAKTRAKLSDAGKSRKVTTQT